MAGGRDEEYVGFAESALPRLRRTAYLLCGDWHRAEDAAQEALIRLYVAWPRVQRREGLMPYAHRTLVRILVDQSRRPWRREMASVEGIEPEAARDAFGQVNTRLVLVAALQKVSPRRRACVVLRFFNDLSVTETAALLGCTEGTVKSQTARGLAELRVLLDRVGVTGIELEERVSTP